MKRHITELEKILISKGYRLDHKNYVGKYSQKVGGYVYTKNFDYVDKQYTFTLTLNQKRNDIVKCQVGEKGHKLYNKNEIKLLSSLIEIVYDEIFDRLEDTIVDDEIVEIVENANNVDSE